ncbi:MAG: cystathionine beta-lyase [Candidatus Pelagibacter sp.]|jgi:cystathionine beta-lyase|nr:cystathionine beta-lyase [Candidatus Pelagibacter sp.]MDP6784033.1 PLP-dependent aspartate aminotransferase family protein [Alphaproteobacteria bacterium]|tara:strand:+ start:18141 stop:19319 length:1179 start_codon:yes stop_codon:yes gene_type:complete
MKKSIKTFLKIAGKDEVSKSSNPAIVRASTIYFDTMQEMRKHQRKIASGKKIKYWDYGRQGSQTTIHLQNILKELEQAHYVFLTQTGFGAVALAIMSICRPGDEIVISDCVYRPTQKLTSQLLAEFNIKAIWYNPNSFEDLKNKVTKKTKLIYVENPGSNTFEFQDLGKITSFAKRKNIYTAIDNTWGTAYYLKPIKIGFDLSITSATKYYSGHSDVMAGTLAVSKKVYKKVWWYNQVSGYRLSADDAYLIIRGLRTLDLRLEKHQENTKIIIKWLDKQKKIIKILYPYKTSSTRYKLWKKYYSGASGLLGIIIKSRSKASVYKFVNSLEFFGIGYSWGGYSSLAVYNDPVEMGSRHFFKLEKNQHLVRVHIGLEDPNDLIQDLKRSLRYVK